MKKIYKKLILGILTIALCFTFSIQSRQVQAQLITADLSDQIADIIDGLEQRFQSNSQIKEYARRTKEISKKYRAVAGAIMATKNIANSAGSYLQTLTIPNLSELEKENSNSNIVRIDKGREK